jgi:hypothetical protein
MNLRERVETLRTNDVVIVGGASHRIGHILYTLAVGGALSDAETFSLTEDRWIDLIAEDWVQGDRLSVF